MRRLDRYADARTTTVPSNDEERRATSAPVRDEDVNVVQYLKDSPRSQSMSGYLIFILVIEQKVGNVRH